ncbi:MAG: hypothetical protein R3A45_07800 [Bdellovibrionota bacterium]
MRWLMAKMCILFSRGFAAQTYPTADLEYDWNNCHLSTKVKLQLLEVQPLPTSMTLLWMDGHIVRPIYDTDDVRFKIWFSATHKKSRPVNQNI